MIRPNKKKSIVTDRLLTQTCSFRKAQIRFFCLRRQVRAGAKLTLTVVWRGDKLKKYMRTVNLNVAGISFSIRSDGDPAYIESLTADLSFRFQALRKGKPRVDQDLKLMTMIALGLLDDLRTARGNLDGARAESRQLATELLTQIDAILAGGERVTP